MSGRLITARELAEQLGVSTGALLRWTRAGQVPAIKMPSGAVRYRPEAIEQWLGERETATPGDGSISDRRVWYSAEETNNQKSPGTA